MRQFERDVIPAISEAYAGRGLEAGRSGDLLNAFATAGRDLSTNLAAQRAGLLRDDQDRVLQGLPQAYSTALTPSLVTFNAAQQNRFLNNPYSNPAYGIAPLALGTNPFIRKQKVASNRGSAIGAAVGAGIGALGNYYSGGGGGWRSYTNTTF
jgi:hypothetical protein